MKLVLLLTLLSTGEHSARGFPPSPRLRRAAAASAAAELRPFGVLTGFGGRGRMS